MAKKTRKVLKQAAQQRAIQQAAANVNTAMAVVTKPVAEAAPRVAKIEAAPAEEYKYVKADLRRIGLLAGSFTVILIALSFIIK